ncbi:MAG: DNA-binding response regulator [Nitrospiraceae bacterium]
MADQYEAASLVILVASPIAVRRVSWSQALQRLHEVHEAADRVALEHKLASVKPAILLLDLALPQLHDARGLSEIQQVSPSTRIILLTKTPSEKEGTAMLAAGARGYCETNIDPLLLKKAVKMVRKGEIWVGRKVISHLLETLVSLTEQQRSKSLHELSVSLENLTPREREIVHQIGRGASNKEIASQLHVTEKTVKAHLTSIFRKLGIPDRLQLALFVNGHRRAPN